MPFQKQWMHRVKWLKECFIQLIPVQEMQKENKETIVLDVHIVHDWPLGLYISQVLADSVGKLMFDVYVVL